MAIFNSYVELPEGTSGYPLRGNLDFSHFRTAIQTGAFFHYWSSAFGRCDSCCRSRPAFGVTMDFLWAYHRSGIASGGDCCYLVLNIYPIGSMYCIYANIWGIWMVNVTIYSIHGSYGYLSVITGHSTCNKNPWPERQAADPESPKSPEAPGDN